jgi:5,10-methylene-tetrahydrofolate dehydrogenase/methenyl tetrahydrofolate cyclohydrolase
VRFHIVRFFTERFHSLNIGNLAKRGGEPLFVSCTPKGILELLKRHNVAMAGKKAVVVGRSNIVVRAY